MVRYQFILFLLIFSCFFSAPTHANAPEQKDYLYRFWSVEAGLPQISVTAIVQDELGFLWVGTQNGLARFDGVNFRVFNTANTAQLYSNFITALYIDRQQRLWIGTANGLVLYQNNSFTAVDNLRLNNGINSIAQREDGTVYIGAGALYRWHEEKKVLEPVLTYDGSVVSLHQQQDTLYIGGITGFGLLNQDSYQWHAAPEELGELQVLHIARQQEDLYLGTTKGLFRWDQGQWQLITLAGHPADKPLEMFYLDPQQHLWVASYNSLYRIYQGQVFSAENIQGQAEDFSWIEAMLQDKFGNIWLGSHAHGLKRLRLPKAQRYSTKQGITDPFVWSLQPWHQDLLVGTNDGLSLLKEGQFEHLKANSHIPNPLIYSMMLDSQQRLWVGTRGGLSRLDGTTLQWQQNYEAISHLLVSTFAEDNDVIWVGTNKGLYYLKNNKLEILAEPALLRDAQVRIIMRDSQQRLWVGTETGLYLRDENGLSKLENLPISNNFISAIKEFPDGNFLIGSLDYGFVFGKPGQWQWFNQSHGLPSSGVIHIEKVKDYLVISNLSGVYRLNYHELTQGNLEQVYVLLDDRKPEAATDSRRCCNGAGSSKGALHNGKLWYPTLDGVLSFPTEFVGQDGLIPQAVLESLTADNVQYFNTNVTLPAEQRDWHFRFTSPFFALASTIHFRYKLEGYDNNWVEAGGRREAFYTNLPPGNYQFSVQSRLASDYRWSDKVSINIRLKPFWHETYLARVVALLILLLLFWAVYRWRLKALARSKQHLEQLVKARTGELHQANEKLKLLSMQDALTGVSNRHYLNTNIQQIISRANRNKTPLIWLLLDLDYFKQVNDNYGHHAGDEVLVAVATILRKSSRNTDHLIRWGGEEFLLLLEQTEDPLLVLERIQSALAQYPWQDKTALQQPLTCSMGAVIQLTDCDWQQSLRLADQALYWIKEHGRNGYMLLEPSVIPCSELVDNININQLIAEGKLKAKSNKDLTI
ncbi:ligand-binding sensor domain-containing diguanylate cyclase [Rheinheimera sp. WS51]|uniref:ligand-binding sensor domain-containing diguanylate cyclase n=1 Tax=Rheinheimera sp. WS51 TaxID=3425886 RepID=UPI003D949D91